MILIGVKVLDAAQGRGAGASTIRVTSPMPTTTSQDRGWGVWSSLFGSSGTDSKGGAGAAAPSGSQGPIPKGPPLPPPASSPVPIPRGATGKLIRDHEKYWSTIVRFVQATLGLDPEEISKNIKGLHDTNMQNSQAFGAFINDPDKLHNLIAHLIVHIVPQNVLRQEDGSLNELLVWNIWAARIEHEVDLFTEDVARTQGSSTVGKKSQTPKDEKFTEQEIKELHPLFKKLCELVLNPDSKLGDLIKGMKEAIGHYNRLDTSARSRLPEIAMIIMLYEQAILRDPNGPEKLWDMLQATWGNKVDQLIAAFSADAMAFAESFDQDTKTTKTTVTQDSNDFIKYVQENIVIKNKFANLIKKQADLDTMLGNLRTAMNILIPELDGASTPTNRTGYKRLALLIDRYVEYSVYSTNYALAAGSPAGTPKTPSAASSMGGGDFQSLD